MWISDRAFTQMRLDLAEANGRVSEVTRQLAVMQQNFDWLANHVNRLEVERSTLLQRLLDVGVVAPQIARARTPPALNLSGQPIPEETRPEGEGPGMALSALMSGSFEDMGDEAATALGVQHDAQTGAVVYTK